MEEQKLVEKYKDIPDTEFVPLECVDENLVGFYEINKLGWIKNLKTGKVRKTFPIGDDGYVRVYLSSKYYRQHILLAKTFILNPENKTIVDHRNHLRSDNRLENIRWATILENNLNKTTFKKRDIWFLKLDNSNNMLEKFHISELSEDIRTCINRSIREGKLYKGFKWRRIDPLVEDYIRRFGEPKNEDWKPCLRLPDYLDCNLNGMLRKRKTGELTVGSVNSWGYLSIKHNDRTYLIHRLIYETFSGELLEDKDQIDHTSTNRQENAFSNLKKCTPSQNMNNPITVNKRSKIIELYSIEGKLLKTFNSSRIASKEIDLPYHIIIQSAQVGRLTSLGIFSFKGEYDKLTEFLSKVIYKYDCFGNFIKCYAYIKDASQESVSCFDNISKCIENQTFCSDGFFYSKGPYDFTGKEKLLKEGQKIFIFKYNPEDGILVDTYYSYSEAERYSNVSRYIIKSSAESGKICLDGFFYSIGPHEFKDEIDLPKKVKRDKTTYKYSKDGVLLDIFSSYSKASNASNISRFSITKYIDTGKLAPDGHYYYHGPHEFTNDEQNKNQDPDNNI